MTPRQGPAAGTTGPVKSSPTSDSPQHSGVRPPTQLARVATWLSKDGEVCAVDLLRAGMPRYAVAIWRLRRLGWSISTEPCTEHGHTTRQVCYVLDSLPPLDTRGVLP